MQRMSSDFDASIRRGHTARVKSCAKLRDLEQGERRSHPSTAKRSGRPEFVWSGRTDGNRLAFWNALHDNTGACDVDSEADRARSQQRARNRSLERRADRQPSAHRVSTGRSVL